VPSAIDGAAASMTFAMQRRPSCWLRASRSRTSRTFSVHSSIVLTSNTYGHVLERRQHQVAQAMDAVLGG